jgi:hypothetical protein
MEGKSLNTFAENIRRHHKKFGACSFEQPCYRLKAVWSNSEEIAVCKQISLPTIKQ